MILIIFIFTLPVILTIVRYDYLFKTRQFKGLHLVWLLNVFVATLAKISNIHVVNNHIANILFLSTLYSIVYQLLLQHTVKNTISLIITLVYTIIALFYSQITTTEKYVLLVPSIISITLLFTDWLRTLES